MEKKTIYTRDTAALILETFEDMLAEKGLRIPCADPAEQAEIDGDTGNDARIYGTEYADLLDRIETYVTDAVTEAGNGAEIIQGEFSGTM